MTNTTTTIEILTTEKLVSLLSNVTKSTVCAIEYVTDESKSRTIGGKKQIQKRVKISNLYLNHDYAKKVQNLSGDTTFQSFEMKGKTRISSTLIQSDKTDEILLDGKILNFESVKQIALYHNGIEISKLDAKDKNLFTPAYSDTEKKETSGRGLVNIEDDFKMITIGLNKIQYIKVFGIEYQR